MKVPASVWLVTASYICATASAWLVSPAALQIAQDTKLSSCVCSWRRLPKDSRTVCTSQQSEGSNVKQIEIREADLSSRIKYFGPTQTLSRRYTTPIYQPSAMGDDRVVDRPLLMFAKEGLV